MFLQGVGVMGAEDRGWRASPIMLITPVAMAKRLLCSGLHSQQRPSAPHCHREGHCSSEMPFDPRERFRAGLRAEGMQPCTVSPSPPLSLPDHCVLPAALVVAWHQLSHL